MGLTYDSVGRNYTVGLALLCATCLVALLYTAWRLPGRPSAPQARGQALGSDSVAGGSSP